MKPRFTITMQDHLTGRLWEMTLGEDSPDKLEPRVGAALEALQREIQRAVEIPHSRNKEAER